MTQSFFRNYNIINRFYTSVIPCNFAIIFCIVFFSSCSSCKKCFQELKGNNIKGKISFIKTIKYSGDKVDRINYKYFDRNKQLKSEVDESSYQIDSTVYKYERNRLIETKNYFRVYRGNTKARINKNLLKRDSIFKAEGLYSIDYMFLKLHYRFIKNKNNVFIIKPLVEKGAWDIKYSAKSRLYKGDKNKSQYIYYDSNGEILSNTEQIFDDDGFTINKNYIRPKGYSNYHKLENDSNGNLLIQNGYDIYDDVKTNIRSYQYKYLKFDEQGNWIIANYTYTGSNSYSQKYKVIREIKYY